VKTVKYNAIHNERGNLSREGIVAVILQQSWDFVDLQSFVLVIFCSFTFLFDSKTATRLPCYTPTPPGGKSGIWLFCYVQMFAVEELPLKQVVFINVTIEL